jgi:hypothetical protein
MRRISSRWVRVGSPGSLGQSMLLTVATQAARNSRGSGGGASAASARSGEAAARAAPAAMVFTASRREGSCIRGGYARAPPAGDPVRIGCTGTPGAAASGPR